MNGLVLLKLASTGNGGAGASTVSQATLGTTSCFNWPWWWYDIPFCKMYCSLLMSDFIFCFSFSPQLQSKQSWIIQLLMSFGIVNPKRRSGAASSDRFWTLYSNFSHLLIELCVFPCCTSVLELQKVKALRVPNSGLGTCHNCITCTFFNRS